MPPEDELSAGFSRRDLGKVMKLLSMEGTDWAHAVAAESTIVFNLEDCAHGKLLGKLKSGTPIDIKEIRVTAAEITVMGQVLTVEEPQGPTVWSSTVRSHNIEELATIERAL